MASDPAPEYPGDPRHPEHERYLLALGKATYQASLLTGVCYDILRVWAGHEGEPLEKKPLGTLRKMIKSAADATAGQKSELASLDRYDEFIDALRVANCLRNDLIHALPVAHGLQRRGSRYIKGDVWTSSGTLASAVRLYATDVSTTKGLAGYVSWTVTQGSGGSYASCSGFTAASSGSAVYSGTLSGFTASATSYASGVGSWSPSGNASETRTFQLGYALSSTTSDSAQGGTATFGLTWEAQNT